MSRQIACLSFDFDAMSGSIARGMTTPTPISRGEFGAVGAGRILDLLARHHIRATWFIPGVVIGTYPEVCERIVAAGHEIGHHGWTHVPPADLSREKEAEGLERGNVAIERLSGRKARGYRSPSWDLSAHTVELLLEHGFDYDSSMMGHDYLPYRARVGDVVEAEEPMNLRPRNRPLRDARELVVGRLSALRIRPHPHVGPAGALRTPVRCSRTGSTTTGISRSTSTGASSPTRFTRW